MQDQNRCSRSRTHAGGAILGSRDLALETRNNGFRIAWTEQAPVCALPPPQVLRPRRRFVSTHQPTQAHGSEDIGRTAKRLRPREGHLHRLRLWCLCWNILVSVLCPGRLVPGPREPRPAGAGRGTASNERPRRAKHGDREQASEVIETCRRSACAWRPANTATAAVTTCAAPAHRMTKTHLSCAEQLSRRPRMSRATMNSSHVELFVAENAENRWTYVATPTGFEPVLPA